MTTKFITLNVWDAEPVRVEINQGEVNSRFLEVQFIDKNQALSLERKTVFFYAEKPDGNLIFNECEVTDAKNGTVNLAVTSQMSLVAGTMKDCEFQILDEKLSKLKIKGLTLEVKPCTDFDSAIESTSEFSVLDESLKEVQNLINSFSDENIIKKITSLDGTESGIDADLLDGKHGNEYSAVVHKHMADDITSGVLPVERGGTGAGDAYTAQRNLGLLKRYTDFSHLTLPETLKDVRDIFRLMENNSYIETQITSNSSKIFQNICPVPSGNLKIFRFGTKFAGYAEFNGSPIAENSRWVGSLHDERAFVWNKVYTSNSVVPIKNGGTGATTALEALSNLHGVEATTSSITYYVNPSGSNSNSGKSSSSPFKTLAYALSKLPKFLKHDVTINVAQGTYTESEVLITGFVGEGTLSIVGTSAEDAVGAEKYIFSNGIQINKNQGRVEFRGIGSGSGFGVYNSPDVVFYYCHAYSPSLVSKSGFFSSHSKVFTLYCRATNFLNGFHSYQGGELIAACGVCTNCSYPWCSGEGAVLYAYGASSSGFTSAHNYSSAGLIVGSYGGTIGI